MKMFDDIIGASLKEPSNDYFGDTADILDSLISGGGLKSASVIAQAKAEVAKLLKLVNYFKQKIQQLSRGSDEHLK